MLDVRTAMRRSAQFHSDLVAVRSGGRELTFATAWQRGVRLANALGELGVKPGDRVAVLEDNSLEAADFYVGTAAGNLVRVPLYRRNSAESHAYMLKHTQCKAVVVSQQYAHELDGVDRKLPGLRVIVRDDGYEEWLAGFSDEDPDPVVGLDDVFIIRHSAGTSGRAKGVAYTHRAWMSATRDWFYQLPPVNMGDSMLHVAPISHGSGYLFLPIWLGGGLNVLAPSFDGRQVIDDLRDDRITHFFAVPTMLADIVERVGGEPQDLPALKVVMVSGAPISEKTARAAHRVFGDTLYQMYGQTEAVPVTFMGPQEWFRDRPGSNPVLSAGRVMPFAELEIRGEGNQPLPVGEQGEVAIRCEGQMTGLWGDPEQTARRLVDGWVLTGDVGRLDARGFLYILDRVDDMIVSGGFNIWPAELERVISALPGVREVVVVGAPHERWGETPVAEVILEEGAEVPAATVVAACREQLGAYKQPGRVVFRTEPFPRSPVGKLQRKAVKEPYWAQEGRRVSGA
ncbi:class I adenylate-forming enzyme family protein [Dactylosporangium sp. NPDC048998]|uniref:class I adenylate-forming enzyme family protein n=1 Tax=Dactylosporangium sp. NPDC048998 TaxID=3363976 RepID=UPI0037107B78